MLCQWTLRGGLQEEIYDTEIKKCEYSLVWKDLLGKGIMINPFNTYLDIFSVFSPLYYLFYPPPPQVKFRDITND